MKILIAADWHGAEIYADAFLNSFSKLEHEVYKFSWKEYFHHYQYSDRYETDSNKLKSIYYRFQNKFLIGPALNHINSDLIERVRNVRPDLVFIYRGTHIFPKTIEYIRDELGCVVFGYNNDDPFSNHYPSYIWRHFLKGASYYDHVFCYRTHNLNELAAVGCRSVSLLRSYYVNERNHKLHKLDTSKIQDVIFVGHYENDGRDEILLHLLKSEFKVKLHGTGWQKSPLYDEIERLNGPVVPVYDGYNSVLNHAKIALVFLSKLNRDTYTRRCFEIPAAETLMLSEYTDDLNDMFTAGIDADYFVDKESLLDKVKYYLNNDSLLKKVAENGRQRLIQDGHEVIDRAKEILNTYELLSKKNA